MMDGSLLSFYEGLSSMSVVNWALGVCFLSSLFTEVDERKVSGLCAAVPLSLFVYGCV